MTCLYFSDLTSADGFVFPITVHPPFVLLFCYLCRHLCMSVAVYVVRVRVSGLMLFVLLGYGLPRSSRSTLLLGNIVGLRRFVRKKIERKEAVRALGRRILTLSPAPMAPVCTAAARKKVFSRNSHHSTCVDVLKVATNRIEGYDAWIDVARARLGFATSRPMECMDSLRGGYIRTKNFRARFIKCFSFVRCRCFCGVFFSFFLSFSFSFWFGI